MEKLKQIISGVILCFWLFQGCQTTSKKIPVISEKLSLAETNEVLKTIEITNHLNKPFNSSSLKGKVHLVNFFFATCTTICPAMETNLLPIVKANETVTFLSFTIDPEKDTVSNLNKHVQERNLVNDNWQFLRTEDSNLKKIASLYLSTVKSEGDDLFYHTSDVVLLDKQLRIRGIYDILDADQRALLKEDLRILKKE